MCAQTEEIEMSEIRSVSSLPLAPHVIQLLTDHGFKFLSEIIELGPLDLARGGWE
jgi:superfamily II DNA/RNA helicase